MRIFGIETSCDETAAAVVRDGWAVESNVVATQHDLHEEFGGVVPEIASRAHLEKITPVVNKALEEANCTWQDIDAIAVGNRPGLIGSLIVGLSAAKALAWALDKPLLAVHHVQAHLVAADLQFADKNVANQRNSNPRDFDEPAIGLVVSGGHTSLFHITPEVAESEPGTKGAFHGFRGFRGRGRLLGKTIDDAVGEAFDKAAIILGLGYPGGPAIDRAAQSGDPHALDLPRSMLAPGSLDFSFSGLKTALLYAVRGKPIGKGKEARFEKSSDDLTDTERADYAASFQHAAIGTLMAKLKRLYDQWDDSTGPLPRRLIVGGGVSANSYLRSSLQAFAQARGISLEIPLPEFCVDNAAMVAAMAYHDFHRLGPSPLTTPAIATVDL